MPNNFVVAILFLTNNFIPDFWLVKYLTAVGCASEKVRLLHCINRCLIALPTIQFSTVVVGDDTQHQKHENYASTLMGAIYKHILPVVQQLVVGPQLDDNDSVVVVAELAANLCLLAQHCPNGLHTFDELLKSFTETNSINVQ